MNILLNKKVVDYRNHKVVLEDGSAIATRTFIWVSGITGVPIRNMDSSLIGRGGRIKVNEYNQVLSWHKSQYSKENYWQKIWSGMKRE